MSRIAAIEMESSTGKARHLLDEVKVKLGKVPNMMRVMANSAGLTDSEIADARTGAGVDEWSTAALKFATEVLKKVSAKELAR
jgi:hypothetical protein